MFATEDFIRENLNALLEGFKQQLGLTAGTPPIAGLWFQYNVRERCITTSYKFFFNWTGSELLWIGYDNQLHEIECLVKVLTEAVVFEQRARYLNVYNPKANFHFDA